MPSLNTTSMIASGPPLPGYEEQQLWPYWWGDTAGHRGRGGIDAAMLIGELQTLASENAKLREENEQLWKLVNQYAQTML